MNLKVVHLVAIQLGMFVGIMGWLAYSQLPFGGSRSAAAVREPIAEPVSTFASASNPADQHSQTVDYRADQERAQPPRAEQPAPVMQHEYSAAAVQQNSALAAQLYYQQIAPRRYAGAGLTNTSIAAVAPTYVVAPEPVAVQADDPVPETVAYVQPTEVVVYPQPQFVVFDNSRHFANRGRSTLRTPGTPLANAHRRSPGTPLANAYRGLDRPRSHLIRSTVCPPAKSFGVVHRRNDSVPSCRPNQGFAARGRR